MLTYNLEERGNVPLYEYLYRRIRDDILSGKLSAGERLPSKRSFAEHLRMSVITVEGAYRQLEAEGYVRTLPKRGVYVEEVEACPRTAKAVPDAGTSGAGTSVPDAGTSASGTYSPAGTEPSFPGPVRSIPGPVRPAARTVWRLDLGSNRTDRALFPAAAWARLARQVLSEEDLSAVPPHQGLERLRRAVAADLRDYRGMEAEAEQIVIGAGAEYLYMMLAQLLGPSAAIALENPGYPQIRMVYRKCAVHCVPVPLDREGMDMDALCRSGADAAHISPAHHYPTGIVTPVGRRHALLRWAEAGHLLIEDDYDSEFRSTGRPLPTLRSIDGGGRVVYLNTFSQTISPALRIGYMVLPPRLLDTYRRELGFYACPVPALEQHVLARFLEGGQYERHLSRTRKEYRTRRAAVLDAFRRCAFADRVSIVERGAGLHFLLRLDTAEADETILRRGEAAGVRLRFLSQFTAGGTTESTSDGSVYGKACGTVDSSVRGTANRPTENVLGGPAETVPDFAHTLVVNYAPLPPDRLPEAMDLLGKVLFP